MLSRYSPILTITEKTHDCADVAIHIDSVCIIKKATGCYEKKYIVRLSLEEKAILADVVKKLKGGSQKVIRAQILLKADADGPNWTDDKISEAFGCRRQTVEGVRERLVRDGFEVVLNGKQRLNPPRQKLLSGEQEAQLIAMRLGSHLPDMVAGR